MGDAYSDGEIARPWLWSEGPLFYDNPTLKRVERPTPPGYDPDDKADPSIIAGTNGPVAGGPARGSSPVRAPQLRPGSCKSSYPLFKDAKERGVLPADARLLVTLPTPLTFNFIYVEPAGWHVTIPASLPQIRASVQEVQDVIPHDELTIQWDCVAETSIWDGRSPESEFSTREYVTQELIEIGTWIADDVALGYHLCYGDPKIRTGVTVRNMKQAGLDVDPTGVADNRGERQFTPPDATTLAELANAILDGVEHPIDYIHMPLVEAAGSPVDPERVKPLADLHIGDQTTLYLGVIDVDQEADDALARVRAVPTDNIARIGISTECGIGRVAQDEFARSIRVMGELADRLAEDS